MSKDQPWIERYGRAGERQWLLTEVVGSGERIALDSIDCVLALADVYEEVD